MALKFANKAPGRHSPLLHFRIAAAYLHGEGGQTKDKAKALEWALRSAESGFSVAQSMVGLLYCTNGNLEKGIAWYTRAAEQGLADCQEIVGGWHFDEYKDGGKDVDANLDAAIRWFELAAQQGRVLAQLHLGNIFWRKTKKYALAEKWLEIASKLGSAPAYFLLGSFYIEGCKFAKALACLQRAAEAGIPMAMFTIDTMVECDDIPMPVPGTSVTLVLLTSAKYNGKRGKVVAAEGNGSIKPGRAAVLLDNSAMENGSGHNLPIAFKLKNLRINALPAAAAAGGKETKQVVMEDPVNPCPLCLESEDDAIGANNARPGFCTACGKLWCHTCATDLGARHMLRTDKCPLCRARINVSDEEDIVRMFKLVTDREHGRHTGIAYHQLGIWHYFGTGCRQDFIKAERYYRRAAELGNAQSQVNLASMYNSNDRGIKRDEAEARKWYQKAMDQGLTYISGKAAYNLGCIYVAGRGLDRRPNLLKAVEFFKKAGELGYQSKDETYRLFQDL